MPDLSCTLTNSLQVLKNAVRCSAQAMVYDRIFPDNRNRGRGASVSE